METSRDWGNEFFESVKWLSIAFSISAVLFAVVAALLLWTTSWGRQFWRVSGAYFTGRGAWRTLLFVAVLLFMTVFAVRMNVLFTYQGNDMYTALAAAAAALAKGDTAGLDAAEAAFWDSLVLFAVLATIHVVRVLLDYYLEQAFDIRWRLWLTEHVTTDWLDGRAFYRARFIDDTIDNPDQRVQEDITGFVQQSRVLSMGGVSAVVTVVSFTQILWDLSGPIPIFGVEIPRAMMFLVLAYVLVTTVVAFWLGRPLIRLNFLYERVTANFRYALVRLRDSAENVAFYRGEGVERRGLLGRFAAVISVYWQVVYRTLKFSGWNLSVNQTAVVFPLILQAPRFFDGSVTLGGVQQTASSFSAIHDSLSFFREAYDDFAAYRAALIRLDGMRAASAESRELPEITVSDLADAVELTGIDVRKPDGTVLIEQLGLRLSSGDALVVKGSSGSGKTTLLRSLAQMWPYGAGELGTPAGDGTLFLSQIPYLPLGDLRTVVCYPAHPDEFSDDDLRDALTKVHLAHLVDRLDEESDWAKILSPGEQQRIAFARILLNRPKVVFLDEATSAVDEGLEFALYNLIRTERPDTILVSVAHRSTVDRHHTQRLELEGNGPWRLEPVAASGGPELSKG
ncbi:ABC transporter ATP-binding protein/permease [Nocardia bovistercoris]|uniref:ABC transporter ATP-binding protein/permease n=1 Tax=Nocardia bovistercoris TaxID=2785916 RepID=A0A931N2V3_9NOCA|nr:ABC transporter ATP-binding protein/permease [Nocardia bovistercoris]